MEILQLVLTALAIVIGVLIWLKLNTNRGEQTVQAIREILSSELKENRLELNLALRESREEASHNIQQLSERIEQKIRLMQEGMNKNAFSGREEQARALAVFGDRFEKSVESFNSLQREKFSQMSLKQDKLIEATEIKLEKMRETVDEKLHKTLEERLGRSFKQVSDHLEKVQKGLGEMQVLASGVGDLKKVLSNVKTRGILGEIQLGNILEQVMSPEQYVANAKTKLNSNDHVEYAIKLPGKSGAGKELLLPIDAKFPQEDYIRLQDAYEAGDAAAVDTATKALVAAVKKFAKDLSRKYIDPPQTTDFGIMFLPFEGLFAEVVRQPGLIELLQRETKIIVTGPTTLAAMLNSLQMGFKTLAIQKRSSEVWYVLRNVKKQFGEFGTVLKKAQEKIRQADGELEKLVTTRTNVMMRHLNKVEQTPDKISQQRNNLDHA